MLDISFRYCGKLFVTEQKVISLTILGMMNPFQSGHHYFAEKAQTEISNKSQKLSSKNNLIYQVTLAIFMQH